MHSWPWIVGGDGYPQVLVQPLTPSLQVQLLKPLLYPQGIISLCNLCSSEPPNPISFSQSNSLTTTTNQITKTTPLAQEEDALVEFECIVSDENQKQTRMGLNLHIEKKLKLKRYCC
jgi:hypothetical protein